MSSSFLRTAVALSMSFAAVGLAASARAQVIILPAVIDRSVHPLRDTPQKPYWVNYSDCVNQVNVVFPTVTFQGAFLGQNLQIWAGSVSCADTTARTGTAPTCWKLYDGSITQSPTSLTLLARDIAGKHLPTDAVNGYGSGTRADCDKGNEPPLPLNIYFSFMQNGTPIGTAATWTQTGLDITRPAPPIDVTGGPGETRIHLDWVTTQEDTDVVGYQFFCDPPRGAASDAGTIPTASVPTGSVRQLLEAGAGTGGSGGSTSWFPDGAVASGGTTSTTTQPNCQDTSAVAAGKAPDSLYYCGSVTGRGTHTGVASGLTNGVDYVVAIAAVDQVGNVGLLSPNVCATPVNVTDFFELYRLLGGKGGGGFCSISPRGNGLLVPLGLLASALGLTVLRRRRRS